MKKLIPATFFTMLLCTVCYAESMKFITVLSSPGRHWEPDGSSWQHAGSSSKESYCTSRAQVNSYEFYVGGSLGLWKGSGGCQDHYLTWSGGTRIGGQLRLYSGRSMPDCYGNDYQSICDGHCKPGESSCTYKCLVSKTVSGCSRGCYRCSNGWHENNADGTGKVLTCVKS